MRFFCYRQSNNDLYFYLYRISYMWYCPLGSVLSFGVGWIFSWISNLILNEKPQDIDPNLFTPILASKLHKQQLKNSNEYHNTVILDTIS